MKISVIFTTYNSPAWLEKVLWGFEQQSDKDFEVVIADDGSGSETRELIARFQQSSALDLRHVWHEDNGFEKSLILNKAVVSARGDYLILTDGDCIPRQDFVAKHRSLSRPGYFLSGGYFKLPMGTSQLISHADIQAQRCFDKRWLLANGVKNSHKLMKLTANDWQAALYNRLTPTKRTWNGHNASCFKSDALHVNGFDTRMKYGGQDCEFGDRLKNAGIIALQIRYSTICVHLDHARGYANEESWKRNNAIRKQSIEEKIVQTPSGIQQTDTSDVVVYAS